MYMSVYRKVLALSLIFDELLHAKMTFAKVKFFLGESFAKVVRYDWNIHGFLKMKFI